MALPFEPLEGPVTPPVGKNYEKLVDGSVFSASIIIIVVGFLIALIGFLGCFGAAKKSGGMLLLVRAIR